MEMLSLFLVFKDLREGGGLGEGGEETSATTPGEKHQCEQPQKGE